MTDPLAGSWWRRQTAGLGVVFVVAMLLVLLFVLLGALATASFEQGAELALEWTTTTFGWTYLFATTGFVLFVLFLALSRFGRIRLGADDETPEFGFASWLAMIFAGGMGVGLVFWGVAEPMMHFNDPPMGLAAPRSEAAAQVGMRYGFFHWGFHQWANFTLVGLAIAYVRFRHSSRGLISEAFRPLLGARVDGAWGYAIDVMAVISTTFGVATTLGLGVLQVDSGLRHLWDLPFGVGLQLAILVFVAMLFTISALTALDKGIRILSTINLALAGLLLLIVFVLGPSGFIVSLLSTTLGEYFGNIVSMSLMMEPFSGAEWVERWTMFYWAWGLSWAPFVGTFIARISRGRTIREFVLGVMLVPVGLSMLWFSTFGGAALHLELNAAAGIADAVAREVPSALFTLFDAMGYGIPLGALAIVLVLTFLITSADSATFVLGMFTSQGVLNPTSLVRVLWGGLQLLVAAVLLLAGGLTALQTFSIIAALPFMLLMLVMAWSLFRDLQAELAEREAAERLLLRRLEGLLLAEEEREMARLAAEETHPTAAEEAAPEPPPEPPESTEAGGATSA